MMRIINIKISLLILISIRSEIMSKLVSDSHCDGCEWYRFTGRSSRSMKDQKDKGHCLFKRCVKRYGFTADRKRRSK